MNPSTVSLVNIFFNYFIVHCGLMIKGMWAVEKDVPKLPYVLCTALPSSLDLSQCPDRQVCWRLVVAILHLQRGWTSEELDFCKRIFTETKSL
jgi:predicted transporter